MDFRPRGPGQRWLRPDAERVGDWVFVMQALGAAALFTALTVAVTGTGAWLGRS